MLGLLAEDGYRMMAEPAGADFVVVNTCGFLEAARRESLDTIREMVQLKEQGQIRGVIVAGCMAQRNRETLLEECPGIDQVVGVFGREEIVRAAGRLSRTNDGPRTILPPAPREAMSDAFRVRITSPHVAYLKIAEGCDRKCTFCTIPSIRGKHVSKPIHQIVDEARRLAEEGVRELILVAQDSTYYGIDLTGQPQLAELVGELDCLEGIEWIRLMYLYPMHVTDGLIDVIASGRKVVPYLDLPLQHANDRVLGRMNRRVTRAATEALLDRLRERIEGLVLRTSMIVGFPGETEEEFEELLEFVVDRRFERLGAFEYSREPDTPAFRLDGHLAAEVIADRRNRLMAAQQEIAFAWNALQVGRQREILIDRCIPGEANAYVGRSHADAPEIDGAVYVTGKDLAPGDIVPCEIVAVREYDLIAVPVGPPR
jgi:ribosomal protein S12 methylthiotransferase